MENGQGRKGELGNENQCFRVAGDGYMCVTRRNDTGDDLADAAPNTKSAVAHSSDKEIVEEYKT